MWNYGDVVAWRGIFRKQVWHVQPTLLVKDTPQEIVTTLLPGTECIAEETYLRGKTQGNRRWSFVDRDWRLATYTWQTNRLLLLFEPDKYYSTILFWNHANGSFLCYYINFQLPIQRKGKALDTLDLDLDLIIKPDLTYEWKDAEDYQKAIEHGVILSDWIQGIDAAKLEVLDRLEKRQYPFDGSWKDWMPDPGWSAPSLPEGWDKI